MHDSTSGNCGRRPTGSLSARVLAAALAGIALLAAACSGGGSPTVAGQTAYQKAVAYSQCVRAHGVPNFPDPNSKGDILITPAGDLAQGSPQFVSANKACQHLLPNSPPLTAAQQRQFTQQALKFVACMRTHGLPDMPDPVVNANGASQHLPRGVSPFSPLFRSAQRACQNLMPGGPP
jgi:hypothetical protein